jgi:hypothetical protein
LTKRFVPSAVAFLSEGTGAPAGVPAEGKTPVEVESVDGAEGVWGIMGANKGGNGKK